MLQFKSVTKSYGNFKALNNVSFELTKGPSVAIVGPNGAGKSTLIQILSGVLEPSQGAVLWQGEKVSPKFLKLQLSVAPQFVDFPAGLRVRDILNFVSSTYGITHDELKIYHQRLGISEIINKPANTLSGGEKKRIILNLAFSAKTTFALLDEPSSALDFRYQKVFREILSEQKKYRTFIFTSHNVDEIQSLPERIINLENGCLVKDTVLTASTQKMSQIRFRSSTLPELPFLVQQNSFGDHWELHTYEPQKLLEELFTHNLTLYDLEVQQLTNQMGPNEMVANEK